MIDHDSANPGRSTTITALANRSLGLVFWTLLANLAPVAPAQDHAQRTIRRLMHLPVHHTGPGSQTRDQRITAIRRPLETTDPRDLRPIPAPALPPIGDVGPSILDPVPLDDAPQNDDRDPKDNAMELRVIMDDHDHRQDAENECPDLTLRQAYTTYLAPGLKSRRAKSTTSDYTNAIAHWEAFIAGCASTASTRAPETVPLSVPIDAVSQIRDDHLNQFGRWLTAEISPASDPTCESAKPTRRMAISTAEKQWKKIRAILRRLGPREKGNNKGVGLLEFVPTMDPIAELAQADDDGGEPVDLTDKELARLYDACDVATWPDANASLQWRTYIVLCVCVGARVEDSATMTTGDFRLFPESPLKRSTRRCESGWLVFTPEKTRRHKGRLIVPLAPCLRSHIDACLSSHGQLFTWDSSLQRPFRRQWDRIVDQAGLSHVKRKHLRSTATNRWGRAGSKIGDPDLGKWVLGHAARDVNERNYMQRERDLIEAAPLLEVPECFQRSPSDRPRQPFLF
ncbi:site-specific integrase [Roseiconus lacunae]|uniref:hypothetical protein n=1 Tax=Roseiconus lacunae TaxID=2605694 RepID=UPI0011F0BA5A|nr:hypothetical protein [Roseiconus lacunae]